MNFSFIKPRSQIPIGDTNTFIVTANPTKLRLEKDGKISISTLIFNTSGGNITVKINKDKTNTVTIPTANTPVNIFGLIEEIEISGATSGVSVICEVLKISDMQKQGVISS
jgi:hypothetical protein